MQIELSTPALATGAGNTWMVIESFMVQIQSVAFTMYIDVTAGEANGDLEL